jgi:acyl-CoA reductase-like NAD-dependent aldehyde dehydrogenase
MSERHPATAEPPPVPADAEDGAGAAAWLEVSNPVTGQTIRRVPNMSAQDISILAGRARTAQQDWEAGGFAPRERVFRRAQKWLIDHSDRFTDVIRSETGKTFEDAQLEITVAARSFGFWASKARKYLADERVRSTSPIAIGKRIVVRHRPVGMVGVIGPWNYPLVNGFCDCVPALMAGNAVIHKPSEVTPLTAELVGEMLTACGLPADVFSVVTGDGAAGAALIDEVDYIMFTGSTETGRKVMERASRTLTPVSLELGGKDPMIVLRDANIDRAANSALYSSMNNAGQVCISIERAYVEAPVYDEFVAKVREIAQKLRVGSPAEPGQAEVGAITFSKQLDIIESHVEDAVAKGAKVLCGGARAPGPGRFYPPTVLVDVDHTMKCMTEETFGPLLPIMKVADADEAIRLANDSKYGLQSAVYTRDTRKGEEVARRIEAGACCVNDAQVNFTAFEAPMGGWKSSGVGSRHGASGIRKYCRQQTVLVNRFAPKRDPYMFPYSKMGTKLQVALTRLLYGRPGRS